MSVQPNFRSAFNGFNREDVVHYIEYLNTKHAAELGQMNSEMDYLRSREPQPIPAPVDTTNLEEVIAQQAARIRELFDRCTQLEADLAAAKANGTELAQQLDQQIHSSEQEKAQMVQQLDEAHQQQISYKTRLDEELEAYRRAERTERYARERAEQLYRQANGALADAAAKVDDASQQVSQMTDRVMAQLAELQDAVVGSKQALRDAAATMYSIRPYGEVK